ncbi:uncharacterized protein [Rutidosis leptorrhynchoides]|uniref:uncharacterized protein isoform X2 n=1 Tax=Rutidosis leptorrhynchoides TaxID=125765 RepID=UPI003A995429
MKESNNTLEFATNAKKVTNSHKANKVVISLEASSCSECLRYRSLLLEMESLLLEKEEEIQQKDREITKLKRERDAA